MRLGPKKNAGDINEIPDFRDNTRLNQDVKCCIPCSLCILFVILLCPGTYAGASKETTHLRGEPITFSRAVERLRDQFGMKKADQAILVDISKQELWLIQDYRILKRFPISASKYGCGSKAGSNKTPLGIHMITSKIGAGADTGTIFKARMNTGKKAVIYKDKTDSEEDFVTTRIMWLEGLEQGVNKGPGIDSRARYIYIHGTPEEGLIGTPASHGCIRMKNTEVIELFDRISEGTLVDIQQEIIHNL